MLEVGRYRILKEIARGGMVVVYRAHDPASGRDVAIKVLQGRLDSRRRKRFEREGKSLARLTHPNVVFVLDSGVLGSGEPFLVLELIAGETLQARLDREGPFPPEEAVEVVRALCGAVSPRSSTPVPRLASYSTKYESTCRWPCRSIKTAKRVSLRSCS